MLRLTVAEIASLLGASAEGDATRLIGGANSLSDATGDEISFAAGKPTNKQHAAAVASSKAACLIVPQSFTFAGPWAIIRVSDPRAAFARVLTAMHPPKQFPHRIHPTAVVADTARIATDCYIGAHVTVGDASEIGSGCVIRDGCVIGDNVSIANNTLLHANVSVYDRVRIGARVIIHANAVIGADGFGFALVEGHYQKFPQIGTVVIEDYVEIGAGCCIDRAALGVTRIGSGTKLDNLVHVGHNCSIGNDVVVAAQTGFSGSVIVGDYAVIGGQVGVGDKARIESRAVVGGKAGILTSATVHAGEPVWGIPARPLRQHLKGLANVNNLPELKQKVHQLGQQVLNLEKVLQEKENLSQKQT